MLSRSSALSGTPHFFPNPGEHPAGAIAAFASPRAPRESAKSHTRCAQPAPRNGLAWAVVLCLLGCLGLPGCAESSSQAAPGIESEVRDSPEAREAARERIADFVDSRPTIDPTWTSDRRYRVEREARAQTLELASESWLVGRAAREAFDRLPLDATDARRALIEIAARADPEGSRERLILLVRTYVPGQDLVRTEGAQLLAETSPRVASELFEQLLTDSSNVTLPPAELLLRYWVLAAHKLAAEQGTPVDATLLTDIATDFKQPAELRYVAITELGRVPGNLSKNALSKLLVESGPDGLLRRKAAQALLELLPPEEACEIFTEVADRETEGTFMPFLLDLLQNNCP